MKKNDRYILWLWTVILVGLILTLGLLPWWVMTGSSPIPLLQPRGLIALQQYELFVEGLWIMLGVGLLVLVLTLWSSWRYRAQGLGTYTPSWAENLWLEGVWWCLSAIAVVFLSHLAWQTTHTLDPYRPLSQERPLRIHAVALRWKWLFIYPEQGVASINELYLPVNRPIRFELSASSPMNSLWIPSLAGQVYAMPSMITQLHLAGNEIGQYRGGSANISGEGFASMRFTAHVVSDGDFMGWVDRLREGDPLTEPLYRELEKPDLLGQDKPASHPVAYYRLLPEVAPWQVHGCGWMNPSNKQSCSTKTTCHQGSHSWAD